MPGHCLIAEADSFIGALLARFAEERDLQPVQARVGEDVVPLACQAQPVVIFLDGELPGCIRGWEAARALRANGELSGIPIVSCSWLAEPDAKALIDDAVAYLRKPDLHYDDFLAALRLAGIISPGQSKQSPAATSQSSAKGEPA